MLVTHEEYSEKGFSAVPENLFARYQMAAEGAIERFTFGRVTSTSLSERNKFGVCELIDLYYYNDYPSEDSGNQQLSSFSNEGYSETYVQPKQEAAGAVKSTEQAAYDIALKYFDRAQLYRGNNR